MATDHIQSWYIGMGKILVDAVVGISLLGKYASLLCFSLYTLLVTASGAKMVTHYILSIDEHVHNGSSYGSTHSFQACG